MSGMRSLLSSHDHHYTLPCFDILQDYLELLERSTISGIIFLQTLVTRMLHDVSRHNYNKILEIVHEPRRGSIVFLNELYQDTHLSQENIQSKEIYLAKCVYKCAKWYSEHFKQSVPIIILTENVKLLEEFEDIIPGLSVMNIEAYLQKYYNLYLELYESIKSTPSIKDNILENTKLYPNYISSDALENGIKNGHYYHGILKVNKNNPQEEAFIMSSKFGGDIFISGMRYRNRAIHGDDVVVKLFEKDKWISRTPEHQCYSDEKVDSDKIERIPTGEVVGILQRHWRDYVACFPENGEYNKGTNCNDRILVIPYDRRIPKIRIVTKLASKLQTERIIVRIDNWEAGSQYPNGHFVSSLGDIGLLETEIATLLVENSISVQQFPKSVLSDLPKDSSENPWHVEGTEIQKRLDLRNSHLIFSIDPKGCTDVDDAISLKILENDKIELGIHIADVTHFIKPSTLIDSEAKKRAISVYLVDRRFDMIPEILSGDLCSLLRGKDRYAVSVICILDNNCNITDSWFGRTIIKSSYQFCYEDAQEIINGVSPEILKENITEWKGFNCNELQEKYEEIRSILLILTHITKILKKKRLLNGALELDNLEVQFEFQNTDSNSIEKLTTKTHLQIHEVIAECMIFANHWVANKLMDTYPSQTLLRHHPPPLKHKLKQLELCASYKGFTVDATTNKTFADSLKQAVDEKDKSFNLIMNMLATRAMCKAQYISTGSAEDYFHYGLGLDRYTHFTSPIRRYADVIVHRLLLSLIDKSSDYIPTNTYLNSLCEHINEKHRAAQFIGRESVKLFQTLYFKDKKPDDPECIVDAVVYSIRSNGILIFIPKYGIKGLCQLRKDDTVAVITNNGLEWLPGLTDSTETKFEVLSDDYYWSYKLFEHITVCIKVQESKSHASKFTFDLLCNMPLVTSKNEVDCKMDSEEEVDLMEDEVKEETNTLDENHSIVSSLYEMFELLRFQSLL
ncbi:DIS3-like exonuclease 1 [Centruroides vittatus]|uniref:DIS3-like exonuclease 1 n=1 Tax=Centruroides vittatus TaxID=120091 RepID=UPI00351098B3